jgi:3-hydroxybutyryl-CoA dehydratase
MPNAAGGLFFEELSVGQAAQTGRTVTEADVLMFGAASGDMNPVHFDAGFAAGTRFEERIAHGMLTAGHISALIGMRLPGPGTIYVSQSLEFKRPVKLGATVTTRVEVKALDERRGFVTLATSCEVEGRTVLTGEAVVMVAKKAP